MMLDLLCERTENLDFIKDLSIECVPDKKYWSLDHIYQSLIEVLEKYSQKTMCDSNLIKDVISALQETIEIDKKFEEIKQSNLNQNVEKLIVDLVDDLYSQLETKSSLSCPGGSLNHHTQIHITKNRDCYKLQVFNAGAGHVFQRHLGKNRCVEERVLKKERIKEIISLLIFDRCFTYDITEENPTNFTKALFILPKPLESKLERFGGEPQVCGNCLLKSPMEFFRGKLIERLGDNKGNQEFEKFKEFYKEYLEEQKNPELKFL